MSSVATPAITSFEILPPRRKVLLVEPAAVNANVFSAFSGLPLLGPVYLGTILEQAGFDVRVVNEDLLGRRLGFSDLDADFLLLTCLTPTVERGYELAGLFKRRNPEGKVYMGGPHVSFLTEEALRYADGVVTGEGERVVVDLLRHGTSEQVVAGTPVEDLDSLPFPRWDLLVNSDRLRIQPIMTSRGCPFSCNFCSVTAMFGRGYRAMSPDRVLAEVERSHAPGIFFYDDNLTANRQRMHAILDGLAGPAGRRVRWWTGQVRADVTKDAALLDKMADTGCARVYVGFESISSKTLKEMHKGQTAEDVRLAIRKFHEHAIPVHGMFIFGADADEPEVLWETSEFVKANRIDSVQYMVLTPLPGTELFARMKREGRLLHRLWRYYDGMHVVFRPKAFEPYSLQKLALDSYLEFYNLLRALHDGFEAALGTMVQAARATGIKLRPLRPYLAMNAAVKLMGSRIIRRWVRGNEEYLKYLSALPA
ncbi:MAG: B12-binding domain-containing radical SAM protein [Planctomycetota bacterium]